MAKIFISYSRRDLEQVRLIVDQLRKLGHVVDIDQDIPAGANWETWIETKIAQSSVTVVIWSKPASESEYVQGEIQASRKPGRLIIPVKLDETPFRVFLGMSQAVDATAMTPAGIATEINDGIVYWETERANSSPGLSSSTSPNPPDPNQNKGLQPLEPPDDPIPTNSASNFQPSSSPPSSTSQSANNSSNFAPRELSKIIRNILYLVLTLVVCAILANVGSGIILRWMENEGVGPYWRTPTPTLTASPTAPTATFTLPPTATDAPAATDSPTFTIAATDAPSVTPTIGFATTEAPPASTPDGSEADALLDVPFSLDALNAWRTAVGFSPLREDPTLTTLAALQLSQVGALNLIALTPDPTLAYFDGAGQNAAQMAEVQGYAGETLLAVWVDVREPTVREIQSVLERIGGDDIILRYDEIGLATTTRQTGIVYWVIFLGKATP